MTECMQRHFISTLLAGVLLAGAPRALLAQTPPASPPTPSSALLTLPVIPQTGEPAPRDEEPRFDFDFDALPLAEVIRMVRKDYHAKTGRHLNVVVPEHFREVAEKNLVTLELKQVSVGELFNLMGMASQRDVRRITGHVQQGDEFVPKFTRWRTGYSFTKVSPEATNPIYMLNAELPPEEPEPPKRDIPSLPSLGVVHPPPPAISQGRQVMFFQLAPYLTHFSLDDITTAIKTGEELAGFKTTPTMKYHEETKLLVVAGEENQLALVERVLRSLISGAGLTPPGTTRPLPVRQPALPSQPAKP